MSSLVSLCRAGFRAAALAAALAATTHAADTTGLERVVVAPSEGKKISAYPCVDRLADDRLLCVYSTNDATQGGKLKVVGTFSSDHGATWSRPITLIDTQGESDYDPSLVVIGSTVLVTSTTVPPDPQGRIVTSRTLAVRSDDDGRAWSAPYAIPMGRRYTSGKVQKGIVLTDGTAMFGFTWEKNLERQPSLAREGDMEEVNAVMLSYDGGRTWASSQSVFLDARKLPDRPHAINGVCEPALAQCDDGSIFMLSRTGLARLYESRSTDGGRTWSAPKPSSLVGHNAPAALCRFRGERAGIAVVWNKSEANRWPLCVAASYDGCRTWSAPRGITNTEGFESSYPGCAQAADGYLVAVYQQARKQGREILAVRFKPEWLGQQDAATATPSSASKH